jgi:hypothetical protein
MKKSSPRIRRRVRKPRQQFEWTTIIAPRQWAVYRHAIETLRKAGIPFMLGGGFALAVYTGRWRNTKDIDLYIAPSDREAAIKAITRAGFTDYFQTLPYDRNWIFRTTRDRMIVDLIWGMANQRAQVDALWFDHAVPISIRGESLLAIPVTEFIWCKLYILQRDHCDWTDVMNVLYAAAPLINWDHLLIRLEDDWPLLKSLLTLYGWLCPASARELPETLRRRLSLERPTSPPPGRNRIRLLDSRGWFAALLPKNKLLEI